jgi:DNA-binding response OmpR family regulator
MTAAAHPKVLSISSIQEDHQTLQTSLASCRCELVVAADVSGGLALLEDVCVVVCERDLLDGTWVEMLQHLQVRPNPPLLIVASRFADERLWAAALNLGAWDVLAKPFIPGEASRSIQLALQQFQARALQPDPQIRGRF